MFTEQSSKVNNGFMNNSENKNTDKFWHTHTHIPHVALRLWAVSSQLNRAAHSLADLHCTAKADWSAEGDREDNSRCRRRVVRLPRMQWKLCLKVLRPVARSKLTVYLCGAVPAASTACLIGHRFIAGLSWVDKGFTYGCAHAGDPCLFLFHWCWRWSCALLR